jgi:hypothetical protein
MSVGQNKFPITVTHKLSKKLKWMEEHFLKNERTLTAFLNTLCCNQCIFFKDKKCTEEKAVQHEIDKVALKECYEKMYIDQWKATPPPVSKAREEMLNGFKTRANDIDEYYVCDNYTSKGA